MRSGLVRLTSLLPEGLPTEFRIFAAGGNATAKGEFLFDAEAAASVMADYERHGTDVMLDLEHLSLEDPQQSRNFDPDARAWCKLELRDGELWAVDVRWTPDGERRLTERTQRYISPAFAVDTATGRITKLVNIAITAMPATHGLVPLVAANAAGGGEEKDDMTAEQMLAIAEALGLGADAKVEDVIAAIGALMAKVKGGVEGEEPEGEPEAPEAMMADKPAEEEKAEAMALRAQLIRDTGAPTALQALSQVAAWKASHFALEAERSKLARERAAMELSERKALVAELVKLGAETPATSGLATGKLAKRLAEEPIAELRDRVGALAKVRGVSAPKAPQSGAHAELSERELRICAEKGVNPEDYARNKSIHLAARGGR